jgi:hypothetical protein
LFAAYKKNIVGDKDKTLNQHSFHKRMLKLTYGILNNVENYENVPCASKIAETFGTSTGISFAFMNLSKYSNDNPGHYNNRDVNLMNAFLRDSHLKTRNFIQDELSLLDPNIVITMNLWDAGIKKDLLCLALGEVKVVDNNNYKPICYNSITINGKCVPLIDMYHFSSNPEGTEDSNFYNPVMKILKKIKQQIECSNGNKSLLF